jgi:sulfonate transport system permease protein
MTPPPSDSALALAPAPGSRRFRSQAGPALQRSVRPRARRLGPGRPIAYGWTFGPVLLLAFWSIGSATGLIDTRTLAAPWTVVSTAADLIAEGRLQDNLLTSLSRSVQGLFWGVLAGLVLGAGLRPEPPRRVPVRRAGADQAGDPGAGADPAADAVARHRRGHEGHDIALIVFIPIYIQTHDALRGIDNRYLELAETLNGSASWRLHAPRGAAGALPGFCSACASPSWAPGWPWSWSSRSTPPAASAT